MTWSCNAATLYVTTASLDSTIGNVSLHDFRGLENMFSPVRHHLRLALLPRLSVGTPFPGVKHEAARPADASDWSALTTRRFADRATRGPPLCAGLAPETQNQHLQHRALFLSLVLDTSSPRPADTSPRLLN